jgi:hypothetical protein
MTIILSNFNQYSASRFLPYTKNRSLIKMLIENLNKTEATIQQIWNRNTEVREEGIALTLSDNIEKEYSIKLPKNSKMKDFFQFESFGKGIFILYEKDVDEFIYVNTNNNTSSVLFSEGGLLNYNINKENSTLSIYYFEHKYNRHSIKVFNAEGEMIHYTPSFNPISDVIYIVGCFIIYRMGSFKRI